MSELGQATLSSDAETPVASYVDEGTRRCFRARYMNNKLFLVDDFSIELYIQTRTRPNLKRAVQYSFV